MYYLVSTTIYIIAYWMESLTKLYYIYACFTEFKNNLTVCVHTYFALMAGD